MRKRIRDILSSHEQGFTTSVIGNEAVARGALEAGIAGVFSYPGTPSTEISEIFSGIFNFITDEEQVKNHPELPFNPLYFEYSINEKIALEKAIAFSIAKLPALCVMKNVGLNVASDPLMSVTYQTISAPLVIVVCDDPGCHSSSNEQDSRHWGMMASVPIFDPATPAEAHLAVKHALKLSGDIHLPVILRLTTRVSHSRGMVTYEAIEKIERQPSFKRLPVHINIPSRTASAHGKLLDKLRDPAVDKMQALSNSLHFAGSNKAELGIVSSGVATAYTREVVTQYELQDKTELLHLVMIHPVPEKQIQSFLSRAYKRVLVLEELDPVVENAVCLIAQKIGVDCEVKGKGFMELTATGEYNLDIVRDAVLKFCGLDPANRQKEPLPDLPGKTPPRPPALCAGCPHRATFYAMKLAVSRPGNLATAGENPGESPVLCGDIGCFGLGAMPPLRMIDTINHMGMSISMAQGLAEAFTHPHQLQNDQRESSSDSAANGVLPNGDGSADAVKTIALLGDGTFFHSGITSLVNAVYTGANMLVIIFDNRTIGMTGHQEHPGAPRHQRHNQLDIKRMVEGLGVSYADSMDPFNIRESYRKIQEALRVKGVSVLISRSPCIFLPEFQVAENGNLQKPRNIIVDHTRCNACHNHADHALNCSRRGSPEGNLLRARAKIAADIAVDAAKQQCPANICNHGFLFSIMDGEYGKALEMVRDKMLFARTCGDICHRPCELFSGLGAKAIPIKALKKFVSASDEDFFDFSAIEKRVQEAEIKDKKIAVIGAGPAGLSAAYDLVQAGYTVQVFEKENEAGGLIKSAIPDFRMDKAGFEHEVELLGKLGVRFSFGFTLGRDEKLEKIADEFDAVLIAIGLSRSKELPSLQAKIPEDLQSDAIKFLKTCGDGQNPLQPGSTVLVIGGGNSAMDAARMAARGNGKNKVTVSCIESRRDMPAFEEEIEKAIAEGIAIIPESFVHDCMISENGRQLQLLIRSCKDKKDIETLQADYVIFAIGQRGDKQHYVEMADTSLDEEERIKADAKTGHTHYKNVFVAGDLCAENHTSVIGAIASGKRAANGIRQLLETYQYEYEGLDALSQLNTQTNYGSGTAELPEEDISRHIEQFNLFQACYQCNHCIDNFGCPAMIRKDGKIQIDQAKCTRCGLCIDVCPNDAIRWEEAKTLPKI